MGRIFIHGDRIYDLGNIKHIDFSDSYSGFYVNIYLLRGHEYIFNPETEKTELIEPKIAKRYGEEIDAKSFIKTISEEWGKYLENNEVQENERHL